MKTMQVIEPQILKCVDAPMPELKDSQSVIIRVRAAGICGSDISIYKGTSPVATYPRVIGHEFAGEIVKIGADCKRIKLNDHVTVNPVVPCGTCRVCQKGRSNVCSNLKVIGVHTDGGYSEYICVPEANVFSVSKDMPYEKAAVIEPFTVAAQVADRGGVEAGDTVLILGAGQIALTVLEVCKLLKARVIMTDLVDERLEKARNFGADFTINTATEDIKKRVMELTDGIGADVSIDAACVGKTLEQAAICTRSAGVVVTMGFADRTVPISELQITKNELDIRGSRLNNNKFPQVIDWVEKGLLDPTRIITHHFPFTELLQGMDKIKNDPEHTMKVILTFDN
ncbi:MAG: zinc-binding alcohol dehydrogenase family protein [Oscillospiraceae bacterium]